MSDISFKNKPVEESVDDGIDGYVAELQDAWESFCQTGDSTRLEELRSKEEEYFEREHALAKARAEASLSMADVLASSPRSSETDQAWLELLTDLRPGPYAQYLLERAGVHGTEEGPVRARLMDIQSQWQEAFGDNPSYKADLGYLGSCLEPVQHGPLRVLKAITGK
jgi:hypothetical protein